MTGFETYIKSYTDDHFVLDTNITGPNSGVQDEPDHN